jgi:HlyD family secretion protein
MKLSMTRTLLPIAALAMSGLGFYHVEHSSHSAPLTSPLEAPAHNPYENSVAASGVVESQTENISIGAALAGLVLDVYVPSNKAGTHVAAGTPLFRIDDRHLKAQLKSAEAQLALSQSRLAKLREQPRPEELPPSLAKVKSAAANLVRSRDQAQRAERLLGTGAVPREEFIDKQQAAEMSAQQLAQAQAEYDLLKAGAWKPDLEIARAEVEQARAQVDQLKTEISRATVVAPVDAVVLQVNVRPGERVSELDNKALMMLGDLQRFHVRVDVDERDIPRFAPGVAAKAYPRGGSQHELRLRFVRTEPYVVPKKPLTGENTELVDTRVLQVIYAIEQDQPGVYVGQQLDVFIDTAVPVAGEPARGALAAIGH